MKWNRIQSNFLRNFVPPLHALSKPRILARLLFVLLSVGLSVCSLADEIDSSETNSVDFLVYSLEYDSETLQAVTNLARSLAGVNATQATVDDNVQSILDLLNSVVQTLSPSSRKGFNVIAYSTPGTSVSLARHLAQILVENGGTVNLAGNISADKSYLYQIQRALYGQSGSPSQSQAIIPLLLALSQKDFASNVWTRSDVQTLLSLPRTNDLSTLELYVGGFVSPIGHMESILSDWGSYLTTQTDGGYDAWRVKDEDLISFLEDWQDSLEDRLATMGQGQSSIESYVGDLVSIIQTYTDDTADNINAIFNGADSFYSDFNDFALSLQAQLEANFLGLSNGLAQIFIDLTPVVEAVQDVNQDLKNLRDETLAYPAGNSQFLMLTNILQKLVADPVQVGIANSNLISSVEVGTRAYSNEVVAADASVTELAEDDDTVPDWEEHRYTSNPLDQFSSSLERPELMFRSFTTGAGQISGDTRIILFDGAFPIMGGQPRRSGNSVNLNISYGLTDTDVAVSQMVNKCGDIMGWVWDVCAAVLIGWLYKRFADYMSGPKLLTA